jgi:hypothetical protein
MNSNGAPVRLVRRKKGERYLPTHIGFFNDRRELGGFYYGNRSRVVEEGY